MNRNHLHSAESPSPRRLHAFTRSIGVALALTAAGCAAPQVKKPTEALVTGQPSWPQEVVHDAERVDRDCGARQTKLLFELKQGKEEQQNFKTLLGSITGGVGTVGGVLGGVSATVINSPDTSKTVTSVAGFVSGGLGAVGSVVTAVYTPGAEKTKNATDALAAIDEKKAAAHAVLDAKDPSSWSDSDKTAWAKAVKDLEAVCK